MVVLNGRDLASQSVIYLTSTETIDNVDTFYEIGSKVISNDGSEKYFLNAEREWKQIGVTPEPSDP